MTGRTALARGSLGIVLAALLATLVSPGLAGAQTPDGPGEPTEFQWMYFEDGYWQQDFGRRDAFAYCREVVDWAAHDLPDDWGGGTGWDYDHDAPFDYRIPIKNPIGDVLTFEGDVRPQLKGLAGGDEDEGEKMWDEAVGREFFGHWSHGSPFTYRPKCHRLLPPDYTSQIPERYRSEAYERCLVKVSGSGRDRSPRPQAVPAWYWEVSIDRRDCSLLLPLRAFGLGGADDERTPWSDWTAEGEAPPPERAGVGKDVDHEFNECRDFMGWRMREGRAGWGGPGSRYDDPPRNASPSRLWHQALDFWVDGDPGGDETTPATWNPDCDLLLTVDVCVPVGGLLPDECLGPAALSRYDIGFSQYDRKDAMLDDDGTVSISRSMWGGSTAFTYTLGKGAVQVALWTVDWAYNGFDVADYDAIADEIGKRYQSNLLGHPDFPVRAMLWLVLFAWSGLMAVRGRLALAGAEVATSIVLVGLTSMLMANTTTYMDSMWTLMDDASTIVLVAGMGDDPAELDPDTSHDDRSEELTRRLRQEIQFIFVEQPYDYLNWGESLGEPDGHDGPAKPPEEAGKGNDLRACAEIRNHVLQRGPHNVDPFPRVQMMDEAHPECHRLAEYNANPDGTRLLGALLVMVCSVLMALLLVLLALTIVMAKLIALLLFALVPFAALAAIPPAYGRRLLWSLLTTVLQVAVVVIGMSFLLSMLLVALHELTTTLPGIDPLERFALMIFFVGLMFVARRYLLKGGQTLAARLSEYFSAPRVPGMTWAATAASASPGIDLTAWERPALYGTAVPAALVGRSVAVRHRERRTTNRSYKNLEKVSRWKRVHNVRNERWRTNHPNRDPIRRQQLG